VKPSRRLPHDGADYPDHEHCNSGCESDIHSLTGSLYFGKFTEASVCGTKRLRL
jgi:hypothetical protein